MLHKKLELIVDPGVKRKDLIVIHTHKKLPYKKNNFSPTALCRRNKQHRTAEGKIIYLPSQ